MLCISYISWNFNSIPNKSKTLRPKLQTAFPEIYVDAVNVVEIFINYLNIICLF